MFMFRKKDKVVSTSTDLHEEAKKFQAAIKEIDSNVSPIDMTIDVVNTYAAKFGVDSYFIAESYMSYLKSNALTAVRKVKESEADYTIMNLEQAAATYGFELEDLNITFFSVE